MTSGTPTWFALATARYQYRLRGAGEEPLHGAAAQRLGLPAAHPTVASLLRDAGYRTALVGKWHLGNPPEFGPLRSGYEEFFGPLSGGVDYWTHCNPGGQHDLWLDNAEAAQDGYLTDLLSRHAVDYIDRVAGQAGTVSSQHCMTMDWSATVLAAAGVQPDPAYPLDGVSLLPVLRHPAGTFARPMFWRMKHRGQRAFRSGDWKYLRVDGQDHLFDLASDARERANLAGRHPGRLEEMRTEWEQWNASMPGIPQDASVARVYSSSDMPQR